MKTHTTLSLLAASTLCAAPVFAVDAPVDTSADAPRKNYVEQDLETLQEWAAPAGRALDNASKALDDAFIPVGKTPTREHPPLTPALIPGGTDEYHLRTLNASGTVPTALVAQESPYRPIDVTRQYLLYKDTGAAELAGWSAQDWEAYQAPFEQAVNGPDGFDPVQRIRVRQYFVDGPTRFINEQGRTLFEGYNAFISDRATLRTGSFLFTFEPELRLRNNARTGYDSSWDARFGAPTIGHFNEDHNSLNIMEATAQVEFWGAHLTLGRQAYVTGPAYHQQLIFSANAAPMWSARLTTAEPMALPGALSSLGFFSPEVFLGMRDHDAAVPDQMLANVRMNWQVTQHLKLGCNLLATTFGGEGHTTDAGTIPHLFSSNVDKDIADQKCGLDWSLLSPWKSAPFEFYGEVGWESRKPTRDLVWAWGGTRGTPGESKGWGWLDVGYTVGFHFPTLDNQGILSATVEYSKTGSGWYVNNWPTAGNNNSMYLYQGNNIGAPMGGDADSIFAELRAKVGTGVEVFGNTAFEQHGKNAAPVTETLLESKLGADVNLGRAVGMFNGWHAEGSVSWDRWSNFQGAKGRDEDGVAIGIGLRRGF